MSETPQHDMPGNSTASVLVDRFLAAELEKLSLKEREKVYDDVHGVSDVTQETPEVIASCLEKMDREIELIKIKDAYEQAKLESPHLVTNRQFLLAFLRCNSFNPRMAALQLIQYFRSKLDIFGTEKISKPRITLEDIGEAATRVLKLGCLQILPNRDSKGLAVVVSRASFMNPALADYDDLSMTRAFWYSMSALSEDEETQKKGFIFVWNRISISDRHENFRRALALRLLDVFQVLPIRLVCLHYCYNSSSPFLAVLASAAKSVIRVRIRTHRGSHTECLYKLMSFGILVQEFPFTEDGCIQLANQIKWLERRRKKEAYLSKNPQVKGAVDLPSNHDVLWGKGKQIFRHPGNILLHELVEAYDEQYNRLSKDGKTNLADQLVSVVQGYSGRFLKLDSKSGMWVEVSNIEAREKVTHRFRRNRAVGLKRRSTHSNMPIVAKRKNSEGDAKRPRMMLNGS